MNTSESNTTANGLLEAVLETLTPRLSVHFNPLLRNIAVSRLGLNPAFILTLVGFSWTAKAIWPLLYKLYGFARQHFMANVRVSSTDDIYLHLMKWLASRTDMVNSRSFHVETVPRDVWEDPPKSGTYLDFSSQQTTAPQFTPARGTHHFWFRGRYFELHRKQETLYCGKAAAFSGALFKDEEYLVISCFGRSPEPIKQLLQRVRRPSRSSCLVEQPWKLARQPI